VERRGDKPAPARKQKKKLPQEKAMSSHAQQEAIDGGKTEAKRNLSRRGGKTHKGWGEENALGKRHFLIIFVSLRKNMGAGGKGRRLYDMKRKKFFSGTLL